MAPGNGGVPAAVSIIDDQGHICAHVAVQQAQARLRQGVGVVPHMRAHARIEAWNRLADAVLPPVAGEAVVALRIDLRVHDQIEIVGRMQS